jgi:hypothetical protein
MLRGLQGSVRGVRFRTNRREIAFFAPARAPRLRAVMERGSSGAARCGDHRAAKFVKFVHFHSVISSNLPQGVSESGRWRVRRQRSCPNSPNWDACPLCLGAGESPLAEEAFRSTRARRTSWAILPLANASSVCRLRTRSQRDTTSCGSGSQQCFTPGRNSAGCLQAEESPSPLRAKSAPHHSSQWHGETR